MSVRLHGYGFPRSVEEVVQPILDIFDPEAIGAFARKLAQLALEVIAQIESGELPPQQGDQYFTLIDLYITDHFRDLKLGQDLRDLIFEGMILHDYGKEYGANLPTMKSLAQKLLIAE